MSKKTAVVMFVGVFVVLVIGSVLPRFSPDQYAMAQHKDHDGHGDHDKDDGPGDHDKNGGHDKDDGHADHGEESAKGGDKHGGDKHDDHGDEGGGHGGHDEHEEGVVHLNESQRSELKLSHVEVKRGSLASMVQLPGEVSWNADRLVHVTPRVRGIVSEVQKTLGDRVEVGDVLCVLDSREMGNAKMEYLSDLSRFNVARADFERAETVFQNTKKLLAILDPEPTPEKVLAQAHDLPVGQNKNKLLTSYTRMKVNLRNYKRNEKLLASKIASEAEFLDAKGEYEVSRADYSSTREEISFDLKLEFLRAQRDFQVAETEMRNAERALHILGLSNEQTAEIAKQGKEVDADISRAVLRSPISGVIVDRHLTRGELVTTETKLYTIADISNVWVMGRAYERDIRFLKAGQGTSVRLDAFPNQLFKGEVSYVASQLDTDTRTVEVRVVLPNAGDQLRAGMFGNVVIHVNEGSGAAASEGTLVPAAALQRVVNGFVVFKATGPGEYKVVPVQVLGKTREFAEVTGAISIGDKVAIGDTFVLKSEAGKEEMGGGHSH
ncbi:MAG: efflux RND transporter periplasmic adaptor subunit [Planctomycetes bacterium]|nr:efflux RND transporter periplasmic adaptor subunit [Planctomycetota bacterium]